MMYAQYTVILIFSIMGIILGLHAAFYVMGKSVKDRNRPAKIKRYINEPQERFEKDFKQIPSNEDEHNSQVEPDFIPAKEKPYTGANRILERLRPQEDMSMDEMLGHTDDEEAAHIQLKRKREGVAYEILKKPGNP